MLSLFYLIFQISSESKPSKWITLKTFAARLGELNFHYFLWTQPKKVSSHFLGNNKNCTIALWKFQREFARKGHITLPVRSCLRGGSGEGFTQLPVQRTEIIKLIGAIQFKSYSAILRFTITNYETNFGLSKTMKSPKKKTKSRTKEFKRSDNSDRGHLNVANIVDNLQIF